MEKQYMTIKEVAECLNFHISTIYDLCYNSRKNNFPAVKIGGRWRISKNKLEKWMEDCK